MKIFFKRFFTIIAFLTPIASLGIYSPIAQAAQTHPAGTLVQNGGTIWQISDDGTKRLAIDSFEKFLSRRFSLTSVVKATTGDLSLPESIMPWGDGVLFADHNIIYQVSGGTKHGFISADVYLGQGFQ